MDSALPAVIAIVVLGALAMAGAGWLWIVNEAFSKDKASGLLMIIIWPLAITYGIRNLPKTRTPLALLVTGIGIIAALIVTAYIIDAVRAS